MWFNSQREYYYDYELPLAKVLWRVEQRGVLVDTVRLAAFAADVESQAKSHLDRIATLTGFEVIDGAKGRKKADVKGKINLGSPKQLGEMLKSLGHKLPKNRKTHQDTTSKDALFILFTKSGDVVLKELLEASALRKISGILKARLLENILYSSFSTAGTVNDRRSSSKNFLGLGTNAQNFPKHSKLGKYYRSCLIARPGKIFLQCDQAQAEDWIVHAIIADVSLGRIDSGIQELRAGADRHQNLASFIFSVPLDQCSKDAPTIFRYLGKKTRHAGNYDMWADTMSIALAHEQQYITRDVCEKLLRKFHEREPQIREVFHRYIQTQVYKKRVVL